MIIYWDRVDNDNSLLKDKTASEIMFKSTLSVISSSQILISSLKDSESRADIR